MMCPTITRNIDGSLHLTWPEGRAPFTMDPDALEQLVGTVNSLVSEANVSRTERALR